MFFLDWAKIISPEQKSILPKREICRLSENSPESTHALGPISPKRKYSRLGEDTFSPG